MTVGQQRRRGRLLEDAIHDAVIDELLQAGYGRLTMEGVAARARTAKASLYRRWSSIEELVIDTVDRRMTQPEEYPDTGSVREDLVVGFGRMLDTLNSPAGRAIAGLLGALPYAPGLQKAARERIVRPRAQAVADTIQRGVDRGEVRPGAVTPFVAASGPALIIYTYLIQGLELSGRDIEDIVDQVVMPAVQVSSFRSG
ncbi:TetR/AcrR family transcriptional regulator [Nonomuraea soli]|uniref:AcrR family transcriptional regulator n=1 Tax=Nonomuraea soli TaxID=1032476 RepID=A0A7W0HS75_9ACTN|nr:TetR/AcrR family transcriptional regulator [Nonomuraea soli]MBA2893754.1 AcrR family transcriptional regulator [Nonomuraea soli]